MPLFDYIWLLKEHQHLHISQLPNWTVEVSKRPQQRLTENAAQTFHMDFPTEFHLFGYNSRGKSRARWTIKKHYPKVLLKEYPLVVKHGWLEIHHLWIHFPSKSIYHISQLAMCDDFEGQMRCPIFSQVQRSYEIGDIWRNLSLSSPNNLHKMVPHS